MIKVKHLNDEQPKNDDRVIICDKHGCYDLASFVSCEEADVDPRDFEGHDYVWDTEDGYESLGSYPFWSPIEFERENKSGKDGVLLKSKTVNSSEGFSIPGYKIVGGTVVKV